jgi:hypothetical protein
VVALILLWLRRLLGTLLLLWLSLWLLALLSLLGPLLPALLSGRLCALLLLGSTLLLFGAGLLFRLASLFTPILLFALLVALCVAGSERPSKQDQGSCVDHSYEFHGRCLRGAGRIVSAQTAPTFAAQSAQLDNSNACHER